MRDPKRETEEETRNRKKQAAQGGVGVITPGVFRSCVGMALRDMASWYDRDGLMVGLADLTGLFQP